MRTLCCAALLYSALTASGQEWTRFRGPNGTGVSDAKTIPTTWTPADFNWKVALPGAGHSSPVLWSNRVFITSCDEKSGQFYVLCFDALTGTKQWQQEFPLTPFRPHNYNTLASATPVVDAARVYVPVTDTAHNTLLALDHSGKKIWSRDLGPFRSQHGSGASPVLQDGLVIVPNEQDGESFLIALEARTGETRWQLPREHKEAAAAYSTPCLFQPKEGPAVLVFNSQMHGISGIAPATGKVLWEFPNAFDKRSVSSPIIAGDVILGSCGSGGGGNYAIAIRPGKTAGTAPERAYEVRNSAPYVPTGLSVGGYVYLWSDAGIVSRIKAATGEVEWQERAGGNYFSSPVYVDGRLFGVTTRGEVVVVAAGEKFEVLARNPLNENTHSTPAVALGRMYLHSSGHLICVGGKPAAGRVPAE